MLYIYLNTLHTGRSRNISASPLILHLIPYTLNPKSQHSLNIKVQWRGNAQNLASKTWHSGAVTPRSVCMFSCIPRSRQPFLLVSVREFSRKSSVVFATRELCRSNLHPASRCSVLRRGQASRKREARIGPSLLLGGVCKQQAL